MKENIISGGLFEKDGPQPLVEGPVNPRAEEIPLTEYERFLRGLELTEGPLQPLWVQGLWTYLGLPGRMVDDFYNHIIQMAWLCHDTPFRKESAKYKSQVEDWGPKSAMFRSHCRRAKVRPGGDPWI